MAERGGNLWVWAASMLAAGVVLLLFNLGVLTAYEPTAQYIVAAVLAALGGGFLASYVWQRDEWWRLMPGWTLLALATMVLLSVQVQLPRPIIAAVLFVGLAIAFVHIYLVKRADHWWAIIPGGFMLVLAGVIGLSVRVGRVETLGAALFVGMGGVFFVLYLLAGTRRHWWALIPGGVLMLFGLLIYTVDNTVQNALLRWWPAGLIVLGLGLAYVAATRVPSPTKLAVNVAAKTPTSSGAPGQLGEYSRPAPGASVEILPDPDERR